jgi:hypothetical protein
MKPDFPWQRFEKNFKYQISSKSVQWESSSMRTDGRTDGHEASSRFSQFDERA